MAKCSEWGNRIPSNPPGEVRNVLPEEMLSTLRSEGVELGSQGEAEGRGPAGREESDSCRGLEEVET